MLLQRDGRCGEVVVSGGSTVVRTIMKLIPLSSFCSYFVGSIVGMFYSFLEVKSREFEVEYIKKSMTSSVLMYSTGAKTSFLYYFGISCQYLLHGESKITLVKSLATK